MRRATRAGRPAGGLPRDAGITLIELVVTMTMMGVFMTMFTGAVIQIYGAVNRTEAIGDSQAQVTRAISRLDQEVRYAAELSTPGTAGGFSYAEYLSTFGRQPRCGQLRLEVASQQLKLRSWQPGTAPPDWNAVPVLVSRISGIAFPAPRQSSGYQQLRLVLQASSGGAGGSSTKDTDVTFTALNSSSSKPNTSVATCVAER